MIPSLFPSARIQVVARPLYRPFLRVYAVLVYVNAASILALGGVAIWNPNDVIRTLWPIVLAAGTEVTCVALSLAIIGGGVCLAHRAPGRRLPRHFIAAVVVAWVSLFVDVLLAPAIIVT
jgi:hypothetical protein